MTLLTPVVSNSPYSIDSTQSMSGHTSRPIMLGELRIFEWRGTSRTEQIVPRPPVKTVLAAVRALDGKARNDVYLYPKAGVLCPYLCVGGGNGRYLLTGVLPGDRFPTLIDPSRPELPKEALRVGGQEGLYPRNWIHGLDVTLRTVEAFWNSGEFNAPDRVLSWTEP